MLGDSQCKSHRDVSLAAGSEAFGIISFILICGLLPSSAIARGHSGGESSSPWNKRLPAKPHEEVIVDRASWYGPAVAGHKTATGEKLDPSELTAATKQLPLQSSALVTNLNNGRSVPVRINDCGPYAKGRDIDVSKRAAETLAMARRGTVPVMVRLIASPSDVKYCSQLRPARRRFYKHKRSRHF
jgi:rare lipoprotein A